MPLFRQPPPPKRGLPHLTVYTMEMTRSRDKKKSEAFITWASRACVLPQSMQPIKHPQFNVSSPSFKWSYHSVRWCCAPPPSRVILYILSEYTLQTSEQPKTNPGTARANVSWQCGWCKTLFIYTRKHHWKGRFSVCWRVVVVCCVAQRDWCLSLSRSSSTECVLCVVLPKLNCAV